MVARSRASSETNKQTVKAVGPKFKSRNATQKTQLTQLQEEKKEAIRRIWTVVWTEKLKHIYNIKHNTQQTTYNS